MDGGGVSRRSPEGQQAPLKAAKAFLCYTLEQATPIGVSWRVVGSAGVRAPWRFGNLNNTTNAGLACANGNNNPSNGYIVQSNSYKLKRKYHTSTLLAIAKAVTAFYGSQDSKRRRERVYAQFERYERYKAGFGAA